MKTYTRHSLNAALLALLMAIGVTACSDSDTPSTSADTDQGDVVTDSGGDEPAPDADPVADTDPADEADTQAPEASDPAVDGESSDS